MEKRKGRRQVREGRRGKDREKRKKGIFLKPRISIPWCGSVGVC